MKLLLPSLLLGLLVGGCAGFGRFSSDQGEFVWAQDLPAVSGPEPEYVLGPGDTLQVRVFNQDNLNFRTRVRRDGRITLPLVGDVDASGLTSQALAAHLTNRLKEFINTPIVTVSLEEARQVQVSLLGEVVRPGVYPLESGAGILQALAVCGGMTEFAHRDRVFVLRSGGKPGRIRFDVDRLVLNGGAALRLALLPGDIVFVE